MQNFKNKEFNNIRGGRGRWRRVVLLKLPFKNSVCMLNVLPKGFHDYISLRLISIVQNYGSVFPGLSIEIDCKPSPLANTTLVQYANPSDTDVNSTREWPNGWVYWTRNWMVTSAPSHLSWTRPVNAKSVVVQTSSHPLTRCLTRSTQYTRRKDADTSELAPPTQPVQGTAELTCTSRLYTTYCFWSFVSIMTTQRATVFEDIGLSWDRWCHAGTQFR